MADHTYTYSSARENFARLMERVTSERSVAIITRRNKEDVVMLSRDEYEGLLETARLIRSPYNRERLLNALDGAMHGRGVTLGLDEVTQVLDRE